MYRFANKIAQITISKLRNTNFVEVCFTNIFVVSQIYLFERRKKTLYMHKKHPICFTSHKIEVKLNFQVSSMQSYIPQWMSLHCTKKVKWNGVKSRTATGFDKNKYFYKLLDFLREHLYWLAMCRSLIQILRNLSLVK